MLPIRELYAVYPSIYPADKSSKVTIAPLERAFCFFEDVEYTVSVASVNSDEENYYIPKCKTTFGVVAKDGVICFEYTFPDEQEHLIILEKDGVQIERFYVYSLKEDLYCLRPLKADFHSHSYRSDGGRDPAALAGYYREQGYDCFALTDHNRFYPGKEIKEVYDGVETGITLITGEEVHAPPSIIHIVHVGGDRSVCDRYFRYPDEYNAEVESDYAPRVPKEIPEKYAGRYARAMWAVDKIHEAGGLAIFAHPYWRPSDLVYNVCDEFSKILLKSGMFDAYELVGGMKQKGINRSINLWAELRAEGLKISVVGSSDVHKIERSIDFPFLFTVCFSSQRTQEEIINAVRAGRSVAVEANGTDEYARQFRAYGELRYVSYAQYLLEHYFPKYERYCEGIGVAMRTYAMGGASAELVEMNAELAEKFCRRFFGSLEPLVPSKAILEFEEKWRAVQIDGPQSKGGNINGAANRRI